MNGRSGLLVASACLTWAMAGCAGKPPPPAASKPPRVVVALPIRATVTDHEEFPGRLEASAMVELRSRVTGYLAEVRFKDGAEVKPGDLLFVIDQEPSKAELQRAQSLLAQAVAQVQRLTADYDRALSLVGTRGVSKEEFDRTAGDKAVAEAAIRVAEANVRLAQQNLDFTEIRAPLAGRVSARFVDPGNLVKADDTLLTTIVQDNPVYAYFDVDERTLLRLRRLVEEGKIKSAREAALPIRLSLADEDDFSHEGTVDFVDNQVNAGTGTLRVRGVFPNAKRLLSPGFFVRVRMPVGEPYVATLVAEQALAMDQGERFAYVVDDKNQTSYRRLRIGSLHQGMRVVLDGLRADERVVVQGLQRVRPGMTVDPQVVEMPTPGGPLPGVNGGKHSVAKGNRQDAE